MFTKFFQFAILICTISLFSTPQAQAQKNGDLKIQMNTEPLAAAYIKFDGVDGESSVKEGRNIVGKNTRNGDKIMVIIKGGKLAGMGVQTASGAFKALSPNASPCSTIHCFSFSAPKCFSLPNGDCICVCGPWFTTDTGRN